MVVQHNLTAMNSNRMLGLTSSAQAKSTEKLSSGYKINRAADDAAGLAISEKMRKQIRGLTQASANAQDGISTVQTAEGALTEVQDMLQRMNELAVKSANGTMSESDRSAVQSEINQLVTEIDRVAETTKFNETYLLKGDRNVAKSYSYSYGAVPAKQEVVATAQMDSDVASGMTAKVSFTTGADATKQNTIAKALRDQGLSINAEVVEKTDINGNKTQGITYNATLNGEAAANFKVNRLSDNEFEITDLEGKQIASLKTSGSNMALNSDNVGNTQTAVVTASDITAAKNAGDVAQYYDKDGNAVSANALGNYFSVLSEEAMKFKAGEVEVPTKTLAVDNTPTDTTTAYQLSFNLADAKVLSEGTVKFTIGSKDIMVDVKAEDKDTDIAEKLAEAINDQGLLDGIKDKSYYTASVEDGTKVVLTASQKGPAAATWASPSPYTIVAGNIGVASATEQTQAKISGELKYNNTPSTAAVGGTGTTAAKGVYSIDFANIKVEEAGKLDFSIGGKTYTIDVAEGDAGAAIVTKLVSAMNDNSTAADLKAIIDLDGDGTAETIGASTTKLTITEGATPGTDDAGAALAKKFNDAELPPISLLPTQLDNGNVAAKAGTQLYDAVGNTIDMKQAAKSVAANQNVVGALNLKLHVGADATRNNQISLNIEAMSAKGLGINGIKVDGSDDSNARASIETIKEALAKVSAQRSDLGAVQNRLEHTINNLDNVVENTTSAESAIRDTDMATEMVKYSNNNILTQAGQAMLAQANQSNQGVLSLLG